MPEPVVHGSGLRTLTAHEWAGNGGGALIWGTSQLLAVAGPAGL
jgi:hypothetical protein